MDGIITAVALGAVGIAALTDLRRGKIYNWLTLPLLALAPLFHLATGGLYGLGSSLLGAVAVAGFLCLLYKVAGPGFGGGDIKLLVALGALLGWPLAGRMVLYTALFGWALALPVMFFHRSAKRTGLNLMMNMLRRHSGEKGLSAAAGSVGPRLPYAVSILCGTLAVLFWGPMI